MSLRNEAENKASEHVSIIDNGTPSCGAADEQKRLENHHYLGYYVSEELWTSVFCDIPLFLETIFPIPEALVDEVFASVSRFNRHYDISKKTKRWKSYPLTRLQAGDERSVCAPFLKLVDIIVRSIPKGQKANALQWHINDKPLRARDRCLPEIKPDIVATLGVHPEEVPSSVPWSRVFVPVAVKTQTAKSGGSAVLELAKYMRLIFHESVDRCFVLGLVLARSNVTVYLAHRAGIIGSRTLNIHEDPKALIRVIVGLSTSSLDCLGLDTSLRMVPQRQTYGKRSLRSMTPKFSYDFKWSPDTDDYCWLLEMPKPEVAAGYGVMYKTKTETFVLFESIALSKGGVIRGSATRVWKAWLLEEMHLPSNERRLFIVKDSWHEDNRRSEGEVYRLTGNTQGIATMRSYSVVRINGKDDTTSSRIQRGLPVKAKPRCIDMPQDDIHPRAMPAMIAHDREHIAQWLKTHDYLPMLDQPEDAPQGKVHMRLVMETYGWSVKYAVSPLELVRVMKDVVEGYRVAYKRGVMHSNMSIENILVTGRAEEGCRGVLIDFGHAFVRGDIAPDDDEQMDTRPFVSAELLLGTPYFAVGARANHHTSEKRLEVPRHEFNHDLESILWIILWICICSSGGGVRRPALHDTQYEDHEELMWAVTSLFESTDSSVLGRTKWAAIIAEDFFDRFVNCVDDFYSALKPVLWALWRVLHKGYQTHDFDFDSTFNGFLAAFDDAERELLANPVALSDAQQANMDQELARRTQDSRGWTHAPVRPVDSERTLGPVEPPIWTDPEADVEDSEGHAHPACPADTPNLEKTCPHVPRIEGAGEGGTHGRGLSSRSSPRRGLRNPNSAPPTDPRHARYSLRSSAFAVSTEATAELLPGSAP